jgi:hypothetical protein
MAGRDSGHILLDDQSSDTPILWCADPAANDGIQAVKNALDGTSCDVPEVHVARTEA